MNTSALRKLQRQLQVLHDVVGEETTLAQALVLLEVALSPGELVTHLADRVHGGHTHTMVSRTIDMLSDHQGRNTRREPAQLVERRDVLGDRRARVLHLTKKGEKLLEALG